MIHEVTEGKARIKVYDGVFYNPKMKQLRDISSLFVKVANPSKTSKVLDATAATGVRGIRYVLESGVKSATFVDIVPKACKNASANAKLNKIRYESASMNFQQFANSTDTGYELVELDPFGSPTPFIYDSMKVSRDGTLLMVTATDTAVLCGANFQACMRAYASKPLHNELCHESGVRILLAYILRNATQFNFGIEPLLSMADLHYIRVFVRLHKGAVKCTESLSQVGFVDYCNHCHNFALIHGTPKSEAKCGFCKKEMDRRGPMWLGRINDKQVVDNMLKATAGRMLEDHSKRLLQSISDELELPFFYSMPKLTRHLHKGSVSADRMIAKLKETGFKASSTSFTTFGVRTNAGIKEVLKAASIL